MKSLGLGVKEHVPSGAVLAELYRVPAVSGLEAREADLAAEFLAVKEPLERLTKPVRERLHHRLRDVLTAASLETVRKIVAAEELTRLFVVALDHLKHLVVKTAAFRQTRKELTMLNAGRKQPVLKRLIHISTIRWIRESVIGFSPGRLKVTALNPIFCRMASR